MAAVFDPVSVGKLNLPNRFVRSATWEGLAGEDGACTGALTDLMVRLAEGRVGLIISSHAYVSPEGQAGPWQLGLHNDDLLPGYRDMNTKVHAAGGTVVAQLAHAGCLAASHLSGRQPVGPSGLDLGEGKTCRGLEVEDIQKLVWSFAVAAVRAKRTGFDGVQIHAAHGYLLSQFLSPAFNTRQDDYGGDVQGRARIVLEILRAIKREAGTEYPVLIKINAQDFLTGGLSVEDMLVVCKLLADEGLDGVEMSGGTPRSGKYIPSRKDPIKGPEDEVYYAEEAKRFKREIGLPLILVGGIRSIEVAEGLVADGDADLIAMARPLIREPDLIKRWQAGDRSPAACKSDNQCFKPILNGEGIYCLTAEKEKQKAARV